MSLTYRAPRANNPNFTKEGAIFRKCASTSALTSHKREEMRAGLPEATSETHKTDSPAYQKSLIPRTNLKLLRRVGAAGFSNDHKCCPAYVGLAQDAGGG